MITTEQCDMRFER
jgi:cyclin-dependent kinase 2